ncbi:MAG: hypothetical protein CSA95_07755 [Bacteroidetes bacterium]|nr:MAG: hypothetical protein CSA95_07755 [Bacteroidota bacterium]PIE88716.1 MAG: hypothetical protein CSA04_00460 [Bacteroidota bacterium]
MRSKYILFFVALFSFFSGSAQIYSRFQADFSIKEIGFDGKQNLMTGSLYFNKVTRSIYYAFNFPEKSAMIIRDSCTIRPDKQTIIPHPMEASVIDFSIFNLFLNQGLTYYGLDQTPYELTQMEEDGEMVISTWELPGKQVKEVGKILLSQKKGQLYGLISMDSEEHVLSKQFFLDYQEIEHLPFPTKVIQISYLGGRESTKITTYRNIILNSNQNAEKYNYTIDFDPDQHQPSMVPIER